MRRKWVIPLIVAASFAVSSLAWAEGRYRTIEAFFDIIDIQINGQSTELKNETIIYNGSMYVPLRTVSQLLGAEVGWDPISRSVSLEFVKDNSDLLIDSSQYGLYQYISLEHNRIVARLTEHLRNGDTEAIRKDILAWGKLREIALDIEDATMADYFNKMMSATELLRTGWASKNFDDYMVAWQLLGTNADALKTLLTKKLDETSP